MCLFHNELYIRYGFSGYLHFEAFAEGVGHFLKGREFDVFGVLLDPGKEKPGTTRHTILPVSQVIEPLGSVQTRHSEG